MCRLQHSLGIVWPPAAPTSGRACSQAAKPGAEPKWRRRGPGRARWRRAGRAGGAGRPALRRLLGVAAPVPPRGAPAVPAGGRAGGTRGSLCPLGGGRGSSARDTEARVGTCCPRAPRGGSGGPRREGRLCYLEGLKCPRTPPPAPWGAGRAAWPLARVARADCADSGPGAGGSSGL